MGVRIALIVATLSLFACGDEGSNITAEGSGGTTSPADSSGSGANRAEPNDCAQRAQDEQARLEREGMSRSDAARAADERRSQCEARSQRPSPEPPPAACASVGVPIQSDAQRAVPPPGTVYVFYTCLSGETTGGYPVYRVERQIGNDEDLSLEGRLQRAFDLYMEGPTPEERDAGLSSPLAGTSPPIEVTTTVTDSTAGVDFAEGFGEHDGLGTTAANEAVVAEMAEVTFQFPELQRLALSAGGDCTSFWRRLEQSTCTEVTR